MPPSRAPLGSGAAAARHDARGPMRWVWARPLLVATCALTLLSSGCRACRATGGTDAATAEAERSLAAQPAARRLARTGAELFGINEAIALPRRWISTGTLPPEREAAELELDATATRDLGATWVRANSGAYPFLSQWDLERADAGQRDWTRADRWAAATGAAGLDAIVVLGPWPGTRTANYTQSYLPADLDAYASYVRAVVERYDGDGVDDSPVLVRPVRVWEVDNEPDLHNSVVPRDARHDIDPATFQTAQEYAQVLLVTAEAIRAADPDALVFSGGIYRPHAQRGRAYLEDVLATPGVLDAIDGVSLHCYSDEDGLGAVTRTLAHARALAPDKLLWITETGVSSRGSESHVDEQWQAGMVAAIHGAFLAGGADRVFWHTLADPPRRGGKQLPFASHSLLRTTTDAVGAGAAGGTVREDKPAGAVYRRMTAALAQADPSTFTEPEVHGGRLLATDRGWLAFWGTPEAPAGAARVLDLRTGLAAAIGPGQPVTAPAWITR